MTHYCIDCDVLTEALRDMEQQCREVEDQRFQMIAGFVRVDLATTLRSEEEQIAKIKKLRYRRDCALEILLKASTIGAQRALGL